MSPIPYHQRDLLAIAVGIAVGLLAGVGVSMLPDLVAAALVGALLAALGTGAAIALRRVGAAWWSENAEHVERLASQDADFIALQMRAMDEVEAEARDIADHLETVTGEVEQFRDQLSSASKRSTVLVRRIALSAAYLRSSRKYPPMLVLQMAAERSGSTALFDLLRGRPGVYMEPLSFLWEELGLRGRRYPTGLSNRGRYTVPVEVQNGIGAFVPVLDDEAAAHVGTIAVEKAHPRFVDHDPARLLAGTERLAQQGTQVVVAIQTRRPLDVMWSMYEYQSRDPGWYGFLDVVDIPGYVAETFASLRQMAGDLPNVAIIDHHDVKEYSPHLGDFLRSLASDDGLDEGSWASAHLDKIRNLQRTAGFISNDDHGRSAAGPDGSWVDAKNVIADATASWEYLLNQRPSLA